MCSLAWWGDLGMIRPLMGTGTWKPMGLGPLVEREDLYRNPKIRDSGSICKILWVFFCYLFCSEISTLVPFCGLVARGYVLGEHSLGASLDLGASDHQLGVAPSLDAPTKIIACSIEASLQTFKTPTVSGRGPHPSHRIQTWLIYVIFACSNNDLCNLRTKSDVKPQIRKQGKCLCLCSVCR